MLRTPTRRWGFVLLLVPCVTLCASTADAQLRLRPYVSGLSLPIGFVQDPTDPTVQFVVEQAGRIRVIKNGTVQAQDLLNLSGVISCCGERGLLGLAFPPAGQAGQQAYLYVNFTDVNGNTVVARYTRPLPGAGNPLVANPASRQNLVWPGGLPYITQPYANHNGGHLAFGPDGYLYIGMGDGGAGNDPLNNAQNPNSLLGKMLRIDVRVPVPGGATYVVPPDNPFVDNVPIAALDEIWAFGLRNPWKFSFDDGAGGTGALVIGDVGQGDREEVDYEPAARGGRNYGWRIREGTNTIFPLDTPAYTPLVNPIYEYNHSIGASITGGFVYRGAALGTSYRGRYLFGDFIVGRVWSAGLSINPTTGEATVTDVMEHTAELGGSAALGNISSFGRDATGELYVVQYGGSVMKLVTAQDPMRTVLAGQFNGDSLPDLLAQKSAGNVTIGINAGSSFTPIQPVYDSASPWNVVGVADFNHDNYPDIVWQGPTGSVVLWTMSPTAAPQISTIYSGASLWRIAGVADVDRDGNPDLIWQSPTGQVVVWFMNGQALRSAQFLWASGSVWRVVGTGDFNGDGNADLLWQGPSGALVAWLMQGASLLSTAFVYSGSTMWGVVGVSDLNGDGKPDLVWHGPANYLVVWVMNGLTSSQNLYLKTVGTEWQLSSSPIP